MLDPYWLGGANRHAKRTSVRAVAIFRKEPVGSAVQEFSAREAMSYLEHASSTNLLGSPTTVPWLNEYLLDASSDRLDSQRRLFERLFRAARAYAVNTAYSKPEEITDKLLSLAR
jgi:hypothetical protein